MIYLKKCILVILCIICLHAHGTKQNNDIKTINKTTMENRLDFDLLNKFARPTHMRDEIGEFVSYHWVFTDESGTRIHLNGNTRRGFAERQSPPPPAFYRILRAYHPNGYLRRTGKVLGNSTLIGEWREYDETGMLIRTVDEDKKFGKFGYNEVLLFLHQQGYINLETGENRRGLHLVYHVEIRQWFVAVRVMSRDTIYTIDGETGEILSKEGPFDVH